MSIKLVVQTYGEVSDIFFSSAINASLVREGLQSIRLLRVPL